MRTELALIISIAGLGAGCSARGFSAELPRVEGSTGLLFAAVRTDGTNVGVRIDAHEVPIDPEARVVLADDPELPDEVEQDFVAAWLPGSLADHDLRPGVVHPTSSMVSRSFETVVADARLLHAHTDPARGPSSFEDLTELPESLRTLPIEQRSHCLGFERGQNIIIETRAYPSFAVSLDDGAALVGFRPEPRDTRRRIFHLDARGEVREVELPATASEFQQITRAEDGALWLVNSGLELWRATAVEAKTATSARFVELQRIKRPTNVPEYPSVCGAGAPARPDAGPRRIHRFAVRARGREVQAFYAMEPDGAFLVGEGDAISCPHRALVRDGGVEVFVVAPRDGLALFSADSDTRLYRYERGLIQAMELFGASGLVSSITMLPTFGLVAATTGALAFSDDGREWTLEDSDGTSQPLAVLEVPHPWAAGVGLFLGGDYGQAGEWWPGEPRPCVKATEALAPSGIKHLVSLGDGALFVAQSPPATSAPTVLVWVRPEHYLSR